MAIDGVKAKAVPQKTLVEKASVEPKKTATLTEKKPAPKTTGFDVAKKKLMSVTGRYSAHKPSHPERADLKAFLTAHRAAVHAGGAAKTTKALVPKLDVEVKTALAAIKLNGFRSDKTELVGEQMAKLTPDQQKQLYANLPGPIRSQVDFEINGGKIVPAGLSLARVGSMSDEQLAHTAALVRGGVIEDLGLQLAVATELGARTAWGKENPDIVEHTKQMITDGKVNFSDGRGGARTETTGEMTFNQKLAGSPEGLASYLAHEGTHSYNATVGGGMSNSVYEEETGAEMAGTRVFAAIGDPNDLALSQDQRDGLNDYVALYKASGEDGVQARMAAEYAGEAADMKEPKKVRDVVKHLAADPGAQKAMNSTFIERIVLAVLKTAPTEAKITEVGEALKNAPAAEKKAALAALSKNLDADGMKVLRAAMNG